MLRGQALKRIGKKAKKGFRGFPLATIAFYGPNQTRATKIAVSITMTQDQEVVDLRRWHSEDIDIRENPSVAGEVLSFMEQFGIRSVVMTDRIIGCPHEEGIDYEGPTCPLCPYWAGRDRWTGELVH
jgi:hypothetical protein